MSSVVQTAPEQTGALGRQIVTISSPLADAEDLDPLLERIGDARFVLLGEASHGTHDYYLWRARISRRLIEEKGFRFIAVEGDWPDCFRVNRYIHGQLGDESAQQVLDQYNAVDSGAKIKGAAILEVDGQPGPEIVLVDTGAGKLRIYRKEGELYVLWRVVELGTFAFQSLEVADFNGDKRDDLLLFGGSR